MARWSEADLAASQVRKEAGHTKGAEKPKRSTSAKKPSNTAKEEAAARAAVGYGRAEWVCIAYGFPRYGRKYLVNTPQQAARLDAVFQDIINQEDPKS